MRLIYFVQYFLPEKASGMQLVEDLLEGFAAQGWYVDLYTPTPTRGVTKEQRKAYAKMRIEKRCGGKVTIHRMHLYAEGRNFIARGASLSHFQHRVFLEGDYSTRRLYLHGKRTTDAGRGCWVG